MANFDLNEKMFNELVSFIRNSIGESNMPIMRETQLEGDLGVTGAEAYNLIVAFGEKYNVDIRNFDFS